VTETIVYDFGPTPHHGIIRDIPVVHENKDGKKFKVDFNLESVRNDRGRNYIYKTSTSDGVVSIKIGDPDRTITGAHTYVIDYTFKGVVTYFSDHDELYFNVTGNDWNVPIQQASANIQFDFGVDESLLKTICYTGPRGSKVQGCTISDLEFEIDPFIPLSSGDGLTIVVSFPQGLVTRYEPQEVKDYSDLWAVLTGLFFLTTYLILPLYFIYRWYKYGRDPEIDSVVVRTFDPPKNVKGRKLTPMELGALVDEVIHPRDISAEIVHLAINKYLKIKEHPKKLLGLMKKEIEFINLKKDTKDLSKHEKDLMNAIFPASAGSMKLSALQKVAPKSIKKLSDDLYKDMVSGGFFPVNPQSVRNKYLGFGVAALVIFSFPLGITLMILSRVMPRKTILGAKTKHAGMGLKQFLVTQERQLEFQEKNYYLFEKLLPYAIAFGVAKVWAGKFSDLTSYQPDWYESNTTHFNPILFTNNLNSNLNSMQSMYKPTTTTSTSGFSSGFGGGGFSGGGFGGGGGGSW